MGNMAYCRFQNTVKDLKDCSDHIEDDLSLDEHLARVKLVAICREIVQEADDDMIPDTSPEEDELEEEIEDLDD